MTPENARTLADTIRARRDELALSASEVARRAGVAKGTITRLELCQIPNPQLDSLKAIAAVLELPLSDLLASADWLPEGELPSFTPYMRTKYAAMPEGAVAEIEAHFAEVARRHGITIHDAAGPPPGADE